jgi:hypothetical protein
MHYTGLSENPSFLRVKYLIVIASLKAPNLHNTTPSLARKGGIQRSTTLWLRLLRVTSVDRIAKFLANIVDYLT